MRDDQKQNDRSQYTDDGFRDGDAREGFGDDKGTRVGRPDGAGAQRAPHDAQGGRQTPGQPGTNTDPVSAGIEGAMTGSEGSGPQQSRVQDAARGEDDGGDKAGDDRRVFDL